MAVKTAKLPLREGKLRHDRSALRLPRHICKNSMARRCCVPSAQQYMEPLGLLVPTGLLASTKRLTTHVRTNRLCQGHLTAMPERRLRGCSHACQWKYTLHWGILRTMLRTIRVCLGTQVTGATELAGAPGVSSIESDSGTRLRGNTSVQDDVSNESAVREVHSAGIDAR